MVSRGRPLLISALAVAAVVSGFGVQPVFGPSPATFAAAAEPDDTGGQQGPNDLGAALNEAEASGERVEITSLTDVDTQVFAEPDGTLTSELYSGPVRAKNSAGDWAEIDTTLVEDSGRLVPKNVPGDVSFSAGGDTSFATVDPSPDGTAADLAWRWPTELPDPVLDGPTATYPNALADGADLVVIATPSGFTHNVVLHEPPAPDAAPLQITVPVTTPGSELRETSSGGLEVKDSDTGTKLAVSPPPIMFDASGTEETDPAAQAVATSVVDTQAGSKVVLTPDPDFLTDPDTVYPVTVDPSFSLYTIADTYVDNSTYSMSQSSSPELRVGTTDSGATKARSFMKFDIDPETIAGATINAASLNLRNFISGTCTASSIQAARITEAWNSVNVTWSNQPTATTTGQAYYAPAAGASGCPSAAAIWDVDAIVQSWANGSANNGIRLAAVNEASNNTWRRYRSAEYTDYDGNFRPKLTVNYTPPDLEAPDVPTVESTYVVDGQYADPLPPGHTFTLRSEDLTVTKFFVWADDGPEQQVTANQGVASYQWAPGFGAHTLTVAAQDPAGNRSVEKYVSFNVREYNSLPEPVEVLDATIDAGETRTVPLQPLGTTPWDVVGAIDVEVHAEQWSGGGDGRVDIADGYGDFTQPAMAVSWSTNDSPGTGVQQYGEVVADPDTNLTIRNTGASSVTVRVVATGWWRWENEPVEEDPEGVGTDPEEGEYTDDVESELEEPSELSEPDCHPVDETDPDGATVCVVEMLPTPEDMAQIQEAEATEGAVPTEEGEIPPAEEGDLLENGEIRGDETSGTFSASSASAPFVPAETGCKVRLTGTEEKPHFRWTRFKSCAWRQFAMLWYEVRGGMPSSWFAYRFKQSIYVAGKSTIMRVVNEVSHPQWDALIGKRHLDVYRVRHTPICDGCTVSGFYDFTVSQYLTRKKYAFFAKATLPSKESGIERPETYWIRNRFDVKLIYAENQPAVSPDWNTSHRSIRIRCDNFRYISAARGCRYPDNVPVLKYKLSDDDVAESAAFYWEVQREEYPWGDPLIDHPTRGDLGPKAVWLQRVDKLTRKKNWQASCNRVRTRHYEKSCDEFPFASTKQGCATWYYKRDTCFTEDVDADDNFWAGQKLRLFYQRMRILWNRPDERFYVKVTY